MARVPVRVTLINGLDEVLAHQGEMPGEDVRRLDVDAVIDTQHFYRLLPEAVVEQLGLPICRRGIWYPDGAWREGEVAEFLSVELWGRPASMDALVMGEELRGLGHMKVDTFGKPDLHTLHIAFKANRISAEAPRSIKGSCFGSMAIRLR